MHTKFIVIVALAQKVCWPQRKMLCLRTSIDAQLCEPMRTIDKIKPNAQSSLYRRAQHTTGVWIAGWLFVCLLLFLLFNGNEWAARVSVRVCVFYVHKFSLYATVLESAFEWFSTSTLLYSNYIIFDPKSYQECQVFVHIHSIELQRRGKKQPHYPIGSLQMNEWMPNALNRNMILQWWLTLSTHIIYRWHAKESMFFASVLWAIDEIDFYII